MDRYALMQAFVRVVECGSFVRAAQRMQTSTSSLSRHIAGLESHLGARLLNRSTRRLSLTETGQAYYERCLQLIADLEEAESLAAQSSTRVRGTLRLTCPSNLAAQPIGPAIAAFGAAHPGLRFEVAVSDRVIDLIEEGYDLAVRIGAVGAERLVARKLGTTELVACAAPAYLARHGTPRVPSELARHAAITYAHSASPRAWRLTGPDGTTHEVRVSGPLHSNSADLAMGAAIAGLGIVFEPEFILAPALAAGHLERVLPAFRGPSLDVWAVYPSRRHLSAKVRQFVAHLAECFSARPLAPQADAGTAPIGSGSARSARVRRITRP
ncbi:MAG: LysR family transcriptional regulator [Rhodocyclaceae bacterium]